MKSFIIFLLYAITSISTKQLKFVQVISRHGSRYPTYPNNIDHSNISTIDKSFGELTPQGKSMHYLLGKALHQRYWKLLFENTEYQNKYHHSLIYAKSTNTNRTIESLQAQLLGLLEDLQPYKTATQPSLPPLLTNNLEHESSEKNNISWKDVQNVKTFPIHVEKGAQSDNNLANPYSQGDFLVKSVKDLCPNQAKWSKQNFKSQTANLVRSDQRIVMALQTLNQIYKTNNITIENAYQFYDNYLCLKAMGEKYLTQMEDINLKPTLQFLYTFHLYLKYVYTPTQKTTVSTTLIANTITNIKQAINNKGPKIVLYSAHDITLAVVLSAFNITNVECIVQSFIFNKTLENCHTVYPEFTSAIIFEVWEVQNKYFLSLSINGKQLSIPICQNNKLCQIGRLEKWFEDFKTVSPNHSCGINRQSSSLQTILLMFVCFIAGLIIPLLYKKYWSQKKTLFSKLQNSQTLQ